MKRLFLVFLVLYGLGLHSSPVIDKSHLVSIANKTDAIVFMDLVFAQPCKEVSLTLNAKGSLEKATHCWPIAIRWGLKPNELTYEKFVADLANDQFHILQVVIEDKDGQATIANKPISELQVTIQKQLQKIWPTYFYE